MNAEREQRVTVEKADFADLPPGAGQQHEDPHGLLVAEPALGRQRAEHPGPGHDLSERVIVNDVTLAAAPALAGFLAAAEEHRMVRAQTHPAGFSQRDGGGVAVVVHERVELLDAGHQRGDA